MRHGLHLSKLSRPTAHRLLMLRNLVSSLLQHQQISTTLPKAKAAQKLADQVIGWGKVGGKDNWEKANGFLLVRLFPFFFFPLHSPFLRRLIMSE